MPTALSPRKFSAPLVYANPALGKVIAAAMTLVRAHPDVTPSFALVRAACLLPRTLIVLIGILANGARRQGLCRQDERLLEPGRATAVRRP